MLLDGQNRSHAVMSQRVEPRSSLDDFPTPPWATRALFAHVLGGQDFRRMVCLEPACGRGHMARILKEHFSEVICSDIHSYGYGNTRDFLSRDYSPAADWIITNPPFRLAENFIIRALRIARSGVAIFARTALLEGVGRWLSIYRDTPPAIVAPFSERVPILRARVERHATTATSYAWFVWYLGARYAPHIIWIPPCRRDLERMEDYDANPPRE